MVIYVCEMVINIIMICIFCDFFFCFICIESYFGNYWFDKVERLAMLNGSLGFGFVFC